MTQVAPLLVLAFLAITFLQSGYDKIKDYLYKCDCIAGNGQRNYALSKISNPDTL